MIFAIGAGLGIAVFFAARFQRSILQPIRSLTASSKELGEGKLDQVVPVLSHDELGELADTFNKMATKLRAYRQAMGDQILHARQMTEITFSAFPDPIIVLSEAGKIDFQEPGGGPLVRKAGQGLSAQPGDGDSRPSIQRWQRLFAPDLAERVPADRRPRDFYAAPRHWNA